MDIEKIEQYVRDLLAVCGYSEDNTESHLYDLLFHQYMAAALFETASAADRSAVDAVTKKLKVFFQCNFKLKERKRRKKEKQENTPTPPKEEIDKEEEIEQKIYVSEKENFGSDLEKRKETFRQECICYSADFGSRCVNDFFNWFSQESRHSGKMLFECERFWNTKQRLELWKNNHISSDNCAAELRLQKVKEAQGEKAASVAKQQMVAEIRQAADEQREREQEQSKQNQELTDDYLKRNPNGLLARFARERKQKEKIIKHRDTETQRSF